MNNLNFTKYDGSGDVNAWIENFGFNKVICKWTDEDLKLIIPASLTGPAKTWYELNKAELDTLDKFTVAIKKEFIRNNYRSLKKSVETRKQQRG